MTQPVVAVIIPTYNRAHLLPIALDSVLAQSTPEAIEAIVIDDGSMDHTPQVLEPYLRQYSDPSGPVVIRGITMNKQGVIAARNTGIAETRSPYVAFLDSDDYWDPRKLERQLHAIRQDADIGVVHTAFRYVDEDGVYQDSGTQRPNNPCVGHCVNSLLTEDLVIFSSVLARRQVIEQAAAAEPHGQPFDPRWVNAQDYDLLLRMARLSRYAYLSEPLTLYRLHTGHGAMGNLRRAFGYHCRVQIEFANRYGREFGIDVSQARQRAGDFLLGRARSAFWQRRLQTARELCELARELDVYDQRFDPLYRKASRPAWLYSIKDRFDRLLEGNRS